MQNLSGTSWSNQFNYFSRDLNGIAGAWKDLMNNILMESNVFNESEITSLKAQTKSFDPTILMNMRHEMVHETEPPPVPKEQIMTDARRLIRQENKVRLAKERESRIVDKEIEELKRSLQSDRMNQKIELEKNPEDKKIGCNTKILKKDNNKLWKRSESYNACSEIDAWFSGGSGPNSTKATENLVHQKEIPNFKITVKKKESATIFEKDKEKEENLSSRTVAKDDSEMSCETQIKVPQEIFEEKSHCWAEECHLNGKNEIMQRFFQSSNEINRIKQIYSDRKLIWNNNHLAPSSDLNDGLYDKHLKIIDKYEERDFISNEKVTDMMEFPKEMDTVETDDDEILCKFQTKTTEIKIKNLNKCSELFNVRYYWGIWKRFVSESKIKRKKINREEKIEKFLQRLSSLKTEQVEEELPATSLKKQERLKNSCSSKSLPKVKVVLKERSKTAPVTLESKFENQRKRMDEHRRDLVVKDAENDSVLSKIEQETVQSSKETFTLLSKDMNKFDANLKGRMRVLKTTSNIGKNRVEKIEAEMQKVFPVPNVLLRMEKRNEERKKRWDSIREKKKQLQEEKEKIVREKEEEMRMKEENEKKKKLEELKEKRRLEKEAEEERKREKEKYKSQLLMAQKHYKYLLLNCGLRHWKALIEFRNWQGEKAKKHFEFELLSRVYYAWKCLVQTYAHQKNCKAASFNRKILLRNYFQVWIESYNEKIKQYQVSVDWHDMKLTEKALRSWIHFYEAEQIAYIKKLEIGESHYFRTLKTKYLKKWRYYPELMRLERDKEDRKRVWRQKVQEVLPDYRPVRLSDSI